MAAESALSDVDRTVLGAPEWGQTQSGPIDNGCNGGPIDPSNRKDLALRGRQLNRAVLAFVALGILLRVGHYLANYPLWGDEAFLALSFLRRGYLDLLRPLEYGQVCPILFLWAELTAVKIFGFSEMSLRLVPLICGVGSVFLFRHVAGRLLSGPALLMAVAIFAVSIHPVRHSADAKPYATDLLIALAMLALAIEWCRAPQRTGWLWLLAGFAPIALAASYPAVLVAGGIALALTPAVWKLRGREPKLAMASYVLVVAATFAALFVGLAHRQQGPGTIRALQNYWADSFPPLDSPVRLASWLARTHAGSMLAYPGGGNRGASSITMILVLIAAMVFWRRGQRTILSLMMMPIVIALVAAAVRLYPYGGEARIMQYMAPAICLMAGLGLSTLVSILPRAKNRRAAGRVAAAALAVMGVVLLEEDLRHPYRAIYDYQAREFARRFWPEQARGADVACLRWDFGIRRPNAAGARLALYLCNQHIYSPSRRRGDRPAWESTTSNRPLRCVVFDDKVLAQPDAVAWLDSMKKRFVFRGQSEVVVPTTGLNQKPWEDHLSILEFLPRPDRPAAAVAEKAAKDHAAR
jgi:Dolichyl-phosphate-mannose-protein mannosyltransferase